MTHNAIPQSNAAHEAPSAGAPKARTWAVVLGLVLLMAACVWLRVYRLDAQSVWWDDYNGLINLHADCKDTSIELARRYNPESAPLYFHVQWYYSRVFGNSPESMRLLSVAVAVLTCPVVYGIGHAVGGPFAGFAALACFVLSPVHIYHGQSIRNYPLFVFLASLSTFCMLRGLSGGRRALAWWGPQLAVNYLIMWTHLFGIFLVFSQACFLGLFFFRYRLRAVAWGMPHLLCFLPVISYALSMPYVEAEGYAHFKPPTPSELFHDMFADDAIGTGYQVLTDGRTWPFLYPHWAEALGSAHTVMDYSLVVLTLLALLGAAWLLLRRVRHEGDGDGLDSRPRRLALLFCVWAIPVLTLAFLSYAWRPCTYPRYTLYSSIALYGLMGAALGALPGRAWRWSGLALMLFLFVYQISFVLPASTRTDWRGAAAHIKSEETGDSLVLVGGPGPGYPHVNIFSYNAGHGEQPVAPAHTLQGAVDKAVCFLRKARSSNGDDPAVWVVWQRQYAWGPMPDFEEALVRHGLQYTYREFRANEKLNVYKVWPNHEFDMLGHVGAYTIPNRVDYTRVLRELGVRHGDREREREVLAIMRRVIDYPRPIDLGDLAVSSSWLTDEGAPELEVAGAYKMLEDMDVWGRPWEAALAYVKLTWGYLALGRIDQAIAAGEKGIALSPGDSGAHLALSVAVYLKGDSKRAQTLGARAVELDTFFIKRYGPLLEALYTHGDIEDARRIALGLRAMHGYHAYALMDLLGLSDWVSSCPRSLPLGPVW